MNKQISDTIHYAHCRLLPGGAANVLTELIRDHGYDEQTKIFTLYTTSKTRDVDGEAIPVVSALPRRVESVFVFFQKNRRPLLSWLFDYRNLMFFYPQLIARLRHMIQTHEPDHLVISSFAVAKNIVTPQAHNNKGETTLYLHSPMQYIHTHRDEYSTKITGIKGWLFRSIAMRLRKRDMLPRSYGTVIANSEYTAASAEKIYHLTTDHIQYPPINECFGRDTPVLRPDNYFVYVGRLVRFVKEVDKLIELVNQTGDQLILIGSGPDEAYLQSIAGPTCVFVGWVDDVEERMRIIRHSRGLLNITKESFGIATAEALLCGVPVLGYDDGATPELVDSDSGILVADKEMDTLIEGLERFKEKEWERMKIWERMRRKIQSMKNYSTIKRID